MHSIYIYIYAHTNRLLAGSDARGRPGRAALRGLPGETERLVVWYVIFALINFRGPRDFINRRGLLIQGGDYIYVYIYIYIYTYIYIVIVICICIVVYIYIYIAREREGETY